MYCSPIQTISYSKWSHPVFDKADINRTPINGVLELTYRCSLHCAHCYIVDHPVKRELSYKEICLIIDQIAEAGCLFLLITGGEPLLRKDFRDIYIHAKKKGLIVTLFTNGTLLTPEIADFLAEYPPFSVEVTLYGFSEETYRKVTGVPGAFRKVLKAIDLLVERGVILGVKVTIIDHNKKDFWDIKEYADKRQLDFRFDPNITPRLDSSKKPCQLRLQPEEILEIDLKHEKRAEEWRRLCREFWGHPASENRYDCAAGCTYFAIDPAGGLRMCMSLPPCHYILPDRKGSFEHGWRNVAPAILAEKRKREAICSRCEIFSICDRCAAHAILEVGDPDAPVPFFCKTAHLRARTFGSEERVEKLNMKGGLIYEIEKKEIQEAKSYAG